MVTERMSPGKGNAMEQYVGLDVSLESTSICVVDAAGAVVWRGTVVSTPEVIAAAIRARAPHVVRIGLETGQLCTWHWHSLRELGLSVVCIDARHAQTALSMQVNKTDSNDAHGLAQLVGTRLAKTGRDQQGTCRSRAQAGGDHAPDLARRYIVPLVRSSGSGGGRLMP